MENKKRKQQKIKKLGKQYSPPPTEEDLEMFEFWVKNDRIQMPKSFNPNKKGLAKLYYKTR